MHTRTRIEDPALVATSSHHRGRRSLQAIVSIIAATAFLASAATVGAHGGGLGDFGRGFGGGLDEGDPGFGRRVGGQITITAIDGNDLTLRTADGWTRTITVTSATTITEAGQAIAVGDLDVGDTVRFSQIARSDGTTTIDAIVVVVPTVGGTVTEVSSGSFKLTARDGTSWTITTTSATAYRLGVADATKSGTAADLKVGSSVIAQGTSATDGTMTAVTVRIRLPRVGGQVTAKTADTITIQRGDGTSTTVHVSGSTSYRVAGTTVATLADVTVGMSLVAEGTQRSDGAIDAAAVVAGAWMHGGRRGMWPTTPDADPSGTTNG